MIYRLLNADAKAWWFHVELRKQGNATEARRRERESIKSAVRTIRAALATDGAHLNIGRGGWSFKYEKGATLSHYGDAQPYRAICEKLGIPVIDSRGADFSKLARVAISGPMVAVGQAPDPAPYHGLSYAPLAYVAEQYREAGATVVNI